MKLKSSTIAFFLIVFSTMLVLPASVKAAGNQCYSNGFFGFPHWYEYLDVQPVSPEPNPENITTCQVVGPTASDGSGIDIPKAAISVALAIIDILLRVAGLVAFGYIVYSGFLFVLAQGDSNKEKQARQTIINAVVGMIVSITAVTLVSFIGSKLSW